MHQFVRGIVDHSAAADEARPEDRVPPSSQQLPVANHVAAIVGFIGHHDHHGVSPAVIDAADDRPAETVFAGILHRPQRGNA